MEKHNYIIPTEENGQYSAIDLFCGAGGVTQGFDSSKDIKVVMAINHSKEAIEAHKRNNPDVVHLTEDIRNVDLIIPFLPKKVNILWASAECTHHSNAAGGQSRDADSRSLADYLDKYIIASNPDVFFAENVKEFMTWGPLMHKKDKNGNLLYKKGKPVMCADPKQKRIYFDAWVKKICDLGYEYSYKLLTCSDYGVHTIRTRYFAQFVKKGLKIAFPEPTHSEFPEKTGLLPWPACKEKLQLDVEGESIFGRERNENIRPHLRRKLSPKTYARHAYGIKKFFLNDFIVKNFNSKHQVSSVDEPLHNIDTRDRHQIARLKINPLLQFITDQQYDEKRVYSIDDPINALVNQERKQLDTVKFITQNIQMCMNASSIEKPLNSILTRDEKVIVTICNNKFILKKYSAKENVGDVNKPFHTIMVKPDDMIVTIKVDSKEDEQKLKEKTTFFHAHFEKDEAELLDFLISDVKARYLFGSELADISGFKEGTYFGKSERIIKKHIGNAVPPKMSYVLATCFIEANRLSTLELACAN